MKLEFNFNCFFFKGLDLDSEVPIILHVLGLHQDHLSPDGQAQ